MPFFHSQNEILFPAWEVKRSCCRAFILAARWVLQGKSLGIGEMKADGGTGFIPRMGYFSHCGMIVGGLAANALALAKRGIEKIADLCPSFSPAFLTGSGRLNRQFGPSVCRGSICTL